MKKTMRITMLGTGHATVTRCVNTCFVVEQTIDGTTDRMLVDGGGGNGILAQLEKAGIALSSIHDLFITHAHTDHLLGCVWVVRMVMQLMLDGRYDGTLNVYSHAKCLRLLRQICQETLHSDYVHFLDHRVILHELHNGNDFYVGDMYLQCFDICSRKEKQYGFIVFDYDYMNGNIAPAPGDYSGNTPIKIRLACLGDEPFKNQCWRYVNGVEWLMCEAFCLYRDRDVFDPYGKYHSTARDAGKLADELGVKNLILYHTEDRHLDTRRRDYTQEAAEFFKGRICVPDDLETIELI